MALRFIRQPSDTPNVANSDDARMIRYAYGGQDGYVKNKGSEIGYQIDGSTFRVTSGVVSLQGYESEVDAGGVEISTAGASSMRYFNIFYEVNLATQTTSIKSAYSTGTYPSFDAGDDLTQNSTGTARLLLYTFTVTNNVIASVQKKVQAIEYTSPQLKNIEERLDSLGFKSGRLFNYDTFSGMGDQIGTITRQGNYVICEFERDSDFGRKSIVIIPDEGFSINQFFPKGITGVGGETVTLLHIGSGTQYYTTVELRVSTLQSNRMYIGTQNGGSTPIALYTLNIGKFGWEADPL